MAMKDKSAVANQAASGKKKLGRGSSTSNKLNTSANELASVVTNTYNNYVNSLTPRLKLIDCFLVFLVALGVLQFLYMLLIGNFPFNAFLGGFIMCVAQFVLTVSLRMQVNGESSPTVAKVEEESETDAEESDLTSTTSGGAKLVSTIGPQRAFGDYIFASLILHFVVYHFIN